MRTSLDMRPELRGTMTPQLVQSIRLLQLSGLEMQAEAAQWLETNPMLELEDDASEDEELPEFERPQLSVEECWMPSQHGSSGTQYSEDDEDQGRGEAVTPEAESIHLRLLEELPLECKDADQLDIAFTLLDYIDERGYLEESIKVISARSGVRSSDLLEALQLVRRITVPGFAAHDLSECLRLQLETHPVSMARNVAIRLAESYLESLARHEFDQVRAELGVDHNDFAAGLKLLRQLDPAPGLRRTEASHVVPDLIVSCEGGNWKLELNPLASPRLRVNAAYERMLGSCGAQGAGMRQQLTEARWLLRGLSMRNETLLKTARAIFQHQFAALTQGDEMLKPLSLRELSMQIGMHESTVSRVTQGKFVQTPRGVVELRRFFSVALQSQNGANASSTAVRSLIKSLVAREPEGRPLCDGAITAELARRGIYIARRTVAKYRDQMHIPSAKLRATMLPTPVAA